MTANDEKTGAAARTAIATVLGDFYVESRNPRFTDSEDEELCISALVKAFDAFEAAIRADEREACALLAEQHESPNRNQSDPWPSEAIRARGTR